MNNEPRGMKCSKGGKSSCVHCNHPKHEGLNCEEAKSFGRIFDDPRTRRCISCKVILQVWKMKDKKNIDCLGCKNVPTPQADDHMSILGFILIYIFLIVLMPWYMGRLVYRKLKKKWTDDKLKEGDADSTVDIPASKVPDNPESKELDNPESKELDNLGSKDPEMSTKRCLIITGVFIIGIIIGIIVLLGGPVSLIIGYIRVIMWHMKTRDERKKYREDFTVTEEEIKDEKKKYPS